MIETLPAAELDVSRTGLRELNRRLQSAAPGERLLVTHPGGRHNLAAGLDAAVEVEIDGHAGYYAAGMNQAATVRIAGNVATGVAENMMSGRVEVGGDAGQSAAASARGGLLVVAGAAAARCAISLKGADVVVGGSVGHASAFMAQTGRLVVCGDAGEGLGDSIYETRVYVRGQVSGLGADCVVKDLRAEHAVELGAVLAEAGFGDLDPHDFRRYGSARSLYHFQPDGRG